MLDQITSKVKSQLSQTKSWLMPNEPGPVQKAYIVVWETNERIPVMYNPTTLKFTRTVEFEKCEQMIQANRAKSGDLTVALFFDTFEAQTDVRKITERIVKLTDFSSGTDKRRMPPTVDFVWDRPLFTGIVASVEQTFTMFLPTGVPVRASLTVTFTEKPSERQRQANEGRPNCLQRWRVSHDDRLYLIALKATGSSANWQQIATANNIRNVLDFPSPALVGRWIVIPDFHNETNALPTSESYD